MQIRSAKIGAVRRRIESLGGRFIILELVPLSTPAPNRDDLRNALNSAKLNASEFIPQCYKVYDGH